VTHARPPFRAAQAALLFPTGGYHWPGMGSDVDRTAGREVFDRVDAALVSEGAPPGALRRLMAGEDQARRQRDAAGWSWSGDFPLSMVAQMALGAALAEAFEARHGTPAVLAGESMGELAAYCAAGALPLEPAALLTHRWAGALQSASDALGLRMAVVEDLEEEQFQPIAAALEAHVVVSEAPRLFVAALPAARLDELDREVARRGGRTLVSNNPCAAHEPRLAKSAEIWEEHARFLEALPFTLPRIPIVSTLHPGEPLDSPGALRTNRADTSFLRVRWDETLAGLPALGVRHFVLFGPPSAGYALKRLRALDPRLARVRVHVVGTLEGVDALPARTPAARPTTGPPASEP